MKKQSHTVPRRRQSASPASRHLPLVDILIDAQAELQELVIASGLRVLEALEEDRAAVCGPRYTHQPARHAYRAGHAPSQVVLRRSIAAKIHVGRLFPPVNERISSACSSSTKPATLPWLNRRHTAAARSSQRATVFQASSSTRAIADRLTPSTLSATTVSNVARRCWRR